MAEAAVAIADHLHDPESSARAFRAKANALYARGDHGDAADLHAKAGTLFESIGKLDEFARTLSGSIQPLLLAGEYEKASAAAERARKIFSDEGNTLRLARLEINIGNIYYRQDRFDEALTCYRAAHDGLTQEQDSEGIAAVLSNMITCYISLNDFPKALDAYRKARKFCEDHNMPLLVTQADYNVAYLHYLRGEYNKAIEMLRRARDHALRTGDAYHHALCNLDLAELYLELNLSAEAADLAQQGYAGFSKLNMGYESAKCLAFLALAETQQERFAAGLELFSQARELFVREKNYVWPSLIDLYCALLFFHERRMEEARVLCNQALSSFPSLNLWNKVAVAYLLLARIDLQTGDVPAALRHANAALEKIRATESPALTYQAHLLLGHTYAVQNDPASAYRAYQEARVSLEKLRGNLRDEETKIAFVKNRLEVYEELIDLCLNRQRDSRATEEALDYVEQAKSRTLIDLLRAPAPRLSEGSNHQSEFLDASRKLREQLNWCYTQIEREQLRPAKHSAERVGRLRTLAQDYEKSLMHLLHEAPRELPVDWQAPSYVSTATVRASIPHDSLIVEFFQVHGQFYAFLLGAKGLQAVRLSQVGAVAGTLRLLQYQLSKFRLGRHYLETFHESLAEVTNAHLKELYDQLLAPLASQLSAKHLVIVPHGILHYIPFHALFDGKRYVIDHHTVSYSPSASVFALCQTRPANSSGPSLVLGVPDPQAPAIADEVEALERVLDQAEVFIGKNASESVLRDRGRMSRIIHIATHGTFRADNPMFSTIRLGDSFLTLFDLYQLKLPAELITLSGCSTGLNVVAGGDELIGLTRGLFQAGAQSLMLSLWDTHDKSTFEFMTSFYRFLKTGQGKADALRSATLDLKSRYPHCYQWAPFVLMGKP